MLFKIGISDLILGGTPMLVQRPFWIYSHPAVYIMVLPAMGIVSEIIPTFSRKTIFGYKYIAYSSLAIASIGSLVWGHHMFTSGQSNLMNMVFSALTFSVSIPSAVKMFNWLTTMYKGSIRLAAPILPVRSHLNESGRSVPFRYAQGRKSGKRSWTVARTSVDWMS